MLTGVGAITLSLLLLLQADKLLASRWLPLADYGYYMLGATVANGLGVLSAPVFNTLLPRLAALAAGHDVARLTAEFRRGTRLMASRPPTADASGGSTGVFAAGFEQALHILRWLV